MKKRRAIALYLIYASALTLILIFGFSASKSLISKIVDLTHSGSIEDVQISMEESYVPGHTYYPEYVAIGDFGGKPGLRFEALDESITVDRITGSFKGNDLERSSYTARIRISSSFDTKFEKIIHISFAKLYPKSYTTRYVSKSVGYDQATLYVGVPVRVYASLPTDKIYSTDGYELSYDKEYFEKNSKGELIPIKPTESGKKLTFSYKTATGVESVSSEFKIAKAPAALDFDRIVLYKMGKVEENVVGSSYFVFLYKGNERVFSDYTLTADKTVATYSSNYTLTYKGAGESEITVTLPDGFSGSLAICPKNVLNYPTFEDLESDVGPTVVYLKKTSSFKFSFPQGTTYKKLTLGYDKTGMTVSVSGSNLLISGKKEGTYPLTVAIDDGVERIERNYLIKVSGHQSLIDLMKYDSVIFVSKYLGHFMGFNILAILAVNMFVHLDRKRRLLTVLEYFSGAVFIAFFTEFCQYFMPLRTASLRDAGIDLLSYVIGTAIALTVLGLWKDITNVKHRRRLVRVKMIRRFKLGVTPKCKRLTGKTVK